MATKTAVIVICQEAIIICAIPPLSPQPPNFFDRNPIHIPPLFTIPIPDEFVHRDHSEQLKGLKTCSSWYFGSTSLYFDMFFRKPYRFQIILKPDFSTASLHVTNPPKCPGQVCSCDITDTIFHRVQDYRICDDTLVSCWFYNDNQPGQYNCGVYMGSKSHVLSSSRIPVL